MNDTPPVQTKATSAGHEAMLHDGWPLLRPLATLQPGITDPRLQALLDHWLRMRAGNLMPA